MRIDVQLLHALALLVAANATPVVIAKLAQERWTAPMDFGYVMPDGERLFGSHKTWRGLASGVVAAAVAAGLMRLPVWIGAGFALASLLADASSSAVKRRMKLEPGSEVVGLDQLAETLVPLLIFSSVLSLDGTQIAVVTIVFGVLDIAVARLRHRRWLR